MNNKIDVKSLMIGLLLGISTLLVLAATYPKPRETFIGRYQITVGDAGVTSAFVLDTMTGEVWSSFHGVPPEQSSKSAFYEPKSK